MTLTSAQRNAIRSWLDMAVPMSFSVGGMQIDESFKTVLRLGLCVVEHSDDVGPGAFHAAADRLASQGAKTIPCVLRALAAELEKTR